MENLINKLLSKYDEKLENFQFIYKDKKLLIHYSNQGNESKIIGGCGITSRSLDYLMDNYFPDLKLKMSKVDKGKIAFIGNGLSVAWKDFYKPTIIDMINYEKLYNILIDIKKEFKQNNIEIKIDNKINIIKKFLKENKKRNVIIINYLFGSNNLPKNLESQFDLVINSFGPPTETLDEQLKLLSHKGELYINYKLKEQIPNHEIIRLENAYIIKKL